MNTYKPARNLIREMDELESLSQVVIDPTWEAVHSRVLEIHARALACHCECLSMNAENCARATLGQAPAYYESNYTGVMEKWGIMNSKGEPLI